jgi:hypothetical protein
LLFFRLRRGWIVGRRGRSGRNRLGGGRPEKGGASVEVKEAQHTKDDEVEQQEIG